MYWSVVRFPSGRCGSVFTPVQLCLTGGPAVSGGTRSSLSDVISGARTSSDYTTAWMRSADLWTASLSHCVFSFVYLSQQQQAQRLLCETILYAGFCILFKISWFKIVFYLLFCLFWQWNVWITIYEDKLKSRHDVFRISVLATPSDMQKLEDILNRRVKISWKKNFFCLM